MFIRPMGFVIARLITANVYCVRFSTEQYRGVHGTEQFIQFSHSSSVNSFMGGVGLEALAVNT